MRPYSTVWVSASNRIEGKIDTALAWAYARRTGQINSIQLSDPKGARRRG